MHDHRGSRQPRRFIVDEPRELGWARNELTAKWPVAPRRPIAHRWHDKDVGASCYLLVWAGLVVIGVRNPPEGIPCLIDIDRQGRVGEFQKYNLLHV